MNEFEKTVLEQLSAIDRRLDGIDKRMDEQFAAVRGEIADLRDDMNQRFRAVNGKLTAISTDLLQHRSETASYFADITETVGDRLQALEAKAQ